MSKFLTKSALALLLSLSWLAAWSITVFDPANFVKNTLTAMQTADQVSQQIKGNLTKLQQLQELVHSRKQLASDALFGSGFASLGELNRRASELQGMLNSVNQLRGGLQDMNGRFNVQFNMAQRNGTTIQQHYARLVQESQAGVAKSQAIINADQQALTRVNRTYDQVKTWQGSISGIDSQVGGLQLLNSQMSSVVAQNAEVISYMAKASMAKEAAEVDATAARNAKAQEEVQTSEKARQSFDKSRDDLLIRLRTPTPQH